MLVAWRRIDAMPPEPDTRLWLFGVARNVINNDRRGQRRRERLGERLREQLREQSQAAEFARDDTAHLVRNALHRLKPLEREVMLLTLGEQLTPAEIAIVLQMNSSTVRTLLQRARTKLRTQLGGDIARTGEMLRRDEDDGHVPVEAQPAPRSHGPEEITP
jgi:RNA polymerase sigma-70 factor (ECF subfamily)